MSFCVKFSGLISQFRILEKSYLSPRIFNVYRFIFGPFLKLNKIYGAPMKPSELFCFKDTINFKALFFLSGTQLKIPAGKCDSYRLWCKWIFTRRLVEDGMSTRLTNTHTDRGFSDLYYVSARKQCILCSALRHNCCLHYCILHRFEIFSAPGIIAHGSIRLPPRSLASLCEAARWQ